MAHQVLKNMRRLAGTASQRSKSLMNAVKILWLVLVLAGTLYFILTHTEELKRVVTEISLGVVLLSAVTLIIAKVVISLMIQVTLARSRQNVSLGHVFYMYNTTQVAKYIPGAIWHFVGRAFLYRKLGMNTGHVGKAILTENIWLVVGASLTATIALLIQALTAPADVWATLAEPSEVLFAPDRLWIWAVLGIILVAALAFAWRFAQATLTKVFHAAWPSPKGAALFMCVQLVLGFSFYWIVHDLVPDAPLLYVIAASAAATALGYVALFAPSGLGVKEGALLLFLAPYMPAEVAFLAASIHRLIYVAVDLLLGAGANVLSGRCAAQSDG